MPPAGFDKIDPSDTPLYGPRKLLMCGFDGQVHAKFRELLQLIQITNLALVWPDTNDASQLVADLFGREDGSGEGGTSDLPRAIIVGGISQNELHQLMNGCRQAGMRPPLWAVLTTTSETWPLIKLLAELEAERIAMAQRRTTPQQ